MKNYSYLSNKYFNYEIERRQHERVKLDGKTETYIYNGYKRIGTLETINISVGGLLFRSVDNFKIGDVLEFVIDIPNYISMQIMCSIVWTGLCDKGFLYGSKFININNLNREIIKSYVNDFIASGKNELSRYR